MQGDGGCTPGNDEALLVSAATDPTHFATLYARYLPRISRYLLHHVATSQDAEDLAATVFARALAGAARYRGEGSVAAWLFSIARHCLSDHYRRTRPMMDIAATAVPLASTEASVEDQVLTQERMAMLTQFVAALPSEQREAVLLRFVGQLRTAEVAQVLGRSEAATKMLVHRAMCALRARYASEED